MGTELQLTAWTPTRPARQAAFDAVFGEFDRLDALMSVWSDGSDIAAPERGRRRSPGAGQPRHARGAARSRARSASGPSGKFDVTFGALSGLWKFDTQDKDNTIPDRARDREAPAAHQLSRSRGRRAGGHGVSEAQGHARQPRRHRQGLRRRSRRGHSAPARAPRFHDPGRRRLYVAGQRGDRPWRLGIRDPRGPGRQELRDARSDRRHVQHVRRLRALLHEGRPPLPPHPRSARRRARARLPQRHARDRSRRHRRRARQGRVHSRPRRRHGAHRDGCRTSKA